MAWLSSEGRALTGDVLVGRNPVILRAGELVADGSADHRVASEALGAMVGTGSIDEFGRLAVRDDIIDQDVDADFVDLLSMPPSQAFVDAHLVLMYPVTLSKRVLVVQPRDSLRSASVDVLSATVGSTDATGRVDVAEYEGDVCDE